jgi:histidine triad (HIT) family protein
VSDCLFCRIVAEELPSDRVAETGEVVAFRDIAPRAPVHVLVVPRRHVDSAHDLGPEDADLLAATFAVTRTVAEQEGIADGYRVTTNIGAGGGQSVSHLHFHVLGGRQLAHIDSGDPPSSGPTDGSTLP